MKRNKLIFIISSVFILLFVYTTLNFSFASLAPSNELSLAMVSPFGDKKSKVVAASCAYTYDRFTRQRILPGIFTPPEVFGDIVSCVKTCADGTKVTGKSTCGGSCVGNCGCTNGAINPTACNNCGANGTFNSINQCVCKNGAENFPDCNNLKCSNGATNYPTCTTCPVGLRFAPGDMARTQCVCSNGATNPSACNICPTGANMTTVGAQTYCVCANGASSFSGCTTCPSGKVMVDGQCQAGCKITNVCGIESLGVMKDGVCSTPDGSSANNSCIINFNINNSSVYPNGSVEFTWNFKRLLPGIGATCGFVDLTTTPARPIPGLQNLDLTRDKARIDNIQKTTLFCLTCVYKKLIDGTSLGDSAIHQWIRVIKIGEGQ